MNAEKERLLAAGTGHRNWHRFGPYLSDRQWGTVREDYSPDGNPWGYITHEMARSKAYRWGEEGIGGLCDEKGLLCFALALWNGQDAILKERYFGLTGPEGNHGEDVKECYYYLDNTPTHSYMQMLYKYPQAAYPYARLREENGRRSKAEPEFELMDTGIFDGDRYFDVFLEYAKADVEDILVKITVYNRGPEEAPLHVLPQLWFRNTWSWGYDPYKPSLWADAAGTGLRVQHRDLGELCLYAEPKARLLFCENETNYRRLYGMSGGPDYSKDAINDYLVLGDLHAVNPSQEGTKAALHYALSVPAGGALTLRLRLMPADSPQPFGDFDSVFSRRKEEADEFYSQLQCGLSDPEARQVQRQAFAGMLWNKQFYYYDIPQWLKGDPAQPPPPESRKHGRNCEWFHLNNADVISMPDKWEFPWYAAWDLAFHCLPLAMVDPEFAKRQLLLLTQEWYMHPNGQLPAYEWKFSDVNPPMHAWAAWRVYKTEGRQGGAYDRVFLETIFQKLLINFTWWVNREDKEGLNVFQGGFLGLDNIALFDRSAPLPDGAYLEQADGTSWMAMYALNMMRIALELAKENLVYQGLATKFFEHFLYIAGAMTNVGNQGIELWDEEDGFFYDVLRTPAGGQTQLKVRSMVGLIPLFAVEVLDDEILRTMPEFTARLQWFLENRPELAALVARWPEPGQGERHLLSLLRGHRMKALLRRMLDESEFLSPFGVRSLSKAYQAHPYSFILHGNPLQVTYRPAESDSDLYGGNSNWRGPIWFPVNFLLIESLGRFYHYYGDDFKVECPTGSGCFVTLSEAARELTTRLCRLFLRTPGGTRPVAGKNEKLQQDPHFRDYLLFHEYFHGDTGAGMGASHQTGWTGLIAKLLHQHSENDQP